jgi:hypothetical protein
VFEPINGPEISPRVEEAFLLHFPQLKKGEEPMSRTERITARVACALLLWQLTGVTPAVAAAQSVESWLEKSIRFWERAPLSMDFQLATTVQQPPQKVTISAHGSITYASPHRFRLELELETRATGRAASRGSLLAIADGEQVWTEMRSPAKSPEVTRYTLEQYDETIGSGGAAAQSDPIAQMRALTELADFEVVEEGENEVTLRGGFTEALVERLGGRAEVFGPDAAIVLTLATETGAPIRLEIDGDGPIRMDMYVSGLEMLDASELPSRLFGYEPPDDVAVQEAGTPRRAPPTRRYSGFIDTTGAVVVQPIHREVSSYSEGLVEVSHSFPGLSGFIDESGRWVIEPRYAIARNFSEGVAAVSLPAGDYGYIDRTGAWVIEPRFGSADSFSEGLARVTVEEGFGWIDRTGATVIGPIDARLAESFSSGAAAFQDEQRRWGLIDRAGKVVLEPRFEQIRDAAEGYAAAREGGRWGFVDVRGRVVVEPRFEQALDFAEGMAPVLADDGWQYIDAGGMTVLRGPFEFALPFAEGLALVQVDGLWGFIDATGELVIEPRFDEAFPFSEGLAPVMVDGLYGFIDRSGALVIDARFADVEPFADGMAAVVVEVEETELLRAIEDEIEWASKTLVELARVRRDRKSLEEQIAGVEELRSQLATMLPVTRDLDSFVAAIQAMGSRAGVTVELESAQDVEREHWVETRVAIAASGGAEAIDRFADLLPRIARAMEPPSRRQEGSAPALFETAVYWAPLPDIEPPRSCSRHAGALGASSSLQERSRAEVLEGLCDELDAESELRSFERRAEVVRDQFDELTSLLAAVRERAPLLAAVDDFDIAADLEEIDELLRDEPQGSNRERPDGGSVAETIAVLCSGDELAASLGVFDLVELESSTPERAEAIEELVEVLRSGDPACRPWAAAALAQLSPLRARPALPILVAAVEGSTESLRFHAAWGLATLGWSAGSTARDALARAAARDPSLETPIDFFSERPTQVLECPADRLRLVAIAGADDQRIAALAYEEEGMAGPIWLLREGDLVADGALVSIGAESVVVQGERAGDDFSLSPYRSEIRLFAERSPEALPAPPGDEVFSGEPLSLDFRGLTDEVLSFLARAYGLNLVVLEDGASRSVEVALRDVPWDRAFSVVLARSSLETTLDGMFARVHEPGVTPTPSRAVDLDWQALEGPEEENPPVSIHVHRALLADVLGTLASFAGIELETPVQPDDRITLIASDVPFGTLLGMVLASRGWEPRVEGARVVATPARP